MSIELYQHWHPISRRVHFSPLPDGEGAVGTPTRGSVSLTPQTDKLKPAVLRADHGDQPVMGPEADNTLMFHGSLLPHQVTTILTQGDLGKKQRRNLIN